MPIVVVITRDVESRYRGFLDAAMFELSPGVYAYPRMSTGVRTRIWNVLTDWYSELHKGSVLMTWADTGARGGRGLATLGEPPMRIVLHDAMLHVRRPPSQSKQMPIPLAL